MSHERLAEQQKERIPGSVRETIVDGAILVGILVGPAIAILAKEPVNYAGGVISVLAVAVAMGKESRRNL